jgi:hypothetical protein
MSPPSNFLTHSNKALTRMSKAMTIAGMVVAALLVLMFGVDFFADLPFGAPSKVMNIGFLVAGSLLGYLSYSTFREQK